MPIENVKQISGHQPCSLQHISFRGVDFGIGRPLPSFGLARSQVQIFVHRCVNLCPHCIFGTSQGRPQRVNNPPLGFPLPN
jgi:hypothetical protein